MSNTTVFIAKSLSTLIKATWLNDVNKFVFGEADADTGVAVRTVDTIAALRLLSAQTWTKVATAGYTTAGDGGGGYFRMDASDTTSADNGGSVIVDAASRRWKLIVSGSINVRQFGAKADGTTNDSASFAASWAYIKGTGGTLTIPPGSYLLNSTWVCDVDLTLPHNYQILGYGAELLAGSSVTGYAIQVYKGYNNFGVRVEGLHFNHRGNTTVNGCIQAAGASNLRIVKCSAEMHNTKATYAAVELGPYTPGDINSNTFWSVVDGFTTRQRTGGDGTNAAVGVRIRGSANANKIMNCSFTSVVDAIRIENDGSAAGLNNALRILHNDFENVTNAIYINTSASTGVAATAMPTGLQIAFNRVESSTTFLAIVGSAVTDPSYPPALYNNYLTVGSVTNYLVNTNNQYVFIMEPSYFGVTTGALKQVFGGPLGTQIVAEGAGNNLEIVRQGGGAGSYVGGHFVNCGYHEWVESSSGIWRTKVTAPASSSDGAPMGPVARTGITYSASMTADCSTANAFVITATNGTAFTINAPTNPFSPQKISIMIRNTSGGALGAATWNAVFKMSAWTQPANGNNRSIEFLYDSTNWVQVSQTGVDVPN